MKRTFNVLVATAVLATQTWAHRAEAGDLEDFVARAQQKVSEKIQETDINASVSILDLGFDIGDILGLNTGIDYEYSLEPQSGKFLRKDKWEDSLRVRVGRGIEVNRTLKRHLTYARFYNEWRRAFGRIMFTPLDLRNISAQTLISMMQPGDLVSITFDKATFKGLAISGESGSVGAGFRAGRLVVGKITAKILKRADNKVTISFADADERGNNVGLDVGIQVIPGLLKIKLLRVNNTYRLRGSSDLATFTYDLGKAPARELLDKLLRSFDAVHLLADRDLRAEMLELNDDLASGLIDLTGSYDADAQNNEATTGVKKVQQVTSRIAAGTRTAMRFRLIPGLFESSRDGLNTINLVNVNLQGTLLEPGQYMVAYKSSLAKNKNGGSNSRFKSVNSAVYKPAPALDNPDAARGYRGLNDLMGISYHNEAKNQREVKELLTYAKLCNAGILECGARVNVRIIDGDSAEAAQLDNDSNVYSNYFFSRGFFEKVKRNLNWNARDERAMKDSIERRVEPLVREFTLNDHARSTRYIVNLLYQVLQKDCYTNLVGIEANRAEGLDRFFRGLFGNLECTADLNDINNDSTEHVRANLRYNMPAILISLYDPNILPPGNEERRASAASISELSQYFTINLNTQHRLRSGAVQTVNGLSFPQNTVDESLQVMQFTSLIETWQQQTDNGITQADKQNMLQNLR